MLNDLLSFIPNMDMQEFNYIQQITAEFNEQQSRNFIAYYQQRRRDPQMILLTTLAGLIGFAGIQRFLVDQVGMGILYFLTGGLCFIGTIVDLVNYKTIALEYNMREAFNCANFVKAQAPNNI